MNLIINIVSFVRKPVICYLILLALITFHYLYYIKYKDNIKTFINHLKHSSNYYYIVNTLIILGTILCIYVLRKPLLSEFKWLYLFSIINLLVCLFTNLNPQIYIPFIFISQCFSFEFTLSPNFFILTYGTIFSCINILIIGMLLELISNWKKISKMLTSLLSLLFSFIYISQLYYSSFFFDVYSFNMIGSAGNTFSVLDSILELTNPTIILIVLITILNQILIFRKPMDK